MKNTAAAGLSWSRYLQLHPSGADAPRAHLAVGSLALKRGEFDVGAGHLRTILKKYPKRRQATSALTLLGRQLLKRKKWGEAETLFTLYADSGQSRKAEIALVGLTRIRIAQGRAGSASDLIAEYRKRFPKGARRKEMSRLQAAVEQR